MLRLVKAALSLDSLVTPNNAMAAFFGIIMSPLLDMAHDSMKVLFFVLLLTVICGDWITGIAAAKKDNTYRSDYGLAGVLRTVFLMWLPIIGLYLDKTVYDLTSVDIPDFAYYAIVLGILYHTWESMTANAYRAGWERWIPKWALKIVSSEIKAKSERAARKK